MAGKTVTVVWDSRDRNRRIIGWVLDPYGLQVNKVMVLTGYVWWYEKYAPDAEQLREALEAQRGLWSEADAMAPWDWQDGVREL